MRNLIIDPDLCAICSPCVAKSVCKVRAIVTIDPGEMPYIDIHRCNRCGVCIDACPQNAIQFEQSSQIIRDPFTQRRD